MEYRPKNDPVIPNGDNDFNNFMIGLDVGYTVPVAVAGLTTGYASYGLTNAQVNTAPNTLHTLVAAFTTAYAGTMNKSIRTHGAVAAKKAARQTLVNFVRPLIRIIQSQPEPAVSRQAKINLGLNPLTTLKGVAGADVTSRTRRAPPTACPEFSVQPSGNLQAKIRFHANDAPLRKNSQRVKSNAKPLGGESCEFFYKITAPQQAGRDPYAGMISMKSATRSPFVYDFPPALGGSNVFVACRWCDARGEYGPWSPFISFIVPIGGSTLVTQVIPGPGNLLAPAV